MEQEIKLRGELFELVRTRKKKATTRLGYKPYEVGKETYFIDPDGNEEPLRIFPFSVVHTSFNMLRSITPDLPSQEGYESWEEFKEVLDGIYGTVLPSQAVTVLQFWN